MSVTIEFGSRKHGCSDRYSDKDLMLIYDTISQEKEKKLKFESMGYSVSVCSIGRARHLALRGSLFIRHVVFEGQPIDGNAEETRLLQSMWTAAPGYDTEIESNKEMLRVIECVPYTRSAGAVVNDILICSIRNVLIRRIANEGTYVFSWRDVIGESLRRGLLVEREIGLLLMARRNKNRYRRGVIPEISSGYLEQLEMVTRRIIDKRRRLRYGRHSRLLSLPDSEQEGSYAQLRAIELLCSYYDFNQSMKKYIQATKDPSYFSNRGPSKAITRDAA